MTNFYSLHGTVTVISDFYTNPNDAEAGYYKLFTVERFGENSKLRGIP